MKNTTTSPAIRPEIAARGVSHGNQQIASAERQQLQRQRQGERADLGLRARRIGRAEQREQHREADADAAEQLLVAVARLGRR